MEFDVSEYTLVFRRVRGQTPGQYLPHHGWTVARPSPVTGKGVPRLDGASDGDIAEVFVVPLCSTLALDALTYERFLSQSGVLDRALGRIARAPLRGPRAVETMRKRIQSLVMAAEVQYIVASISA